MKKIAMILAFLMLIPGAAFGLEMMNDSSMDDVTGQAGVSIAMDDVQIFMNIDKIAWLDADGYAVSSAGEAAGGEFAPGAVGISNFQLDVLNINAPDTVKEATSTTGKADVYDLSNTNTASGIDLQYTYGDTTVGDGASLANGTVATQTLGLNNYKGTVISGTYTPSALTIDASSQLPVLSAAKQSVYNNGLTQLDVNDDNDVNIGGVLIGVPTLEIYIPTLSMTPAVFNVSGADAADNAKGVNPASDYGTVQMDGITFTTLSGWIEIAPH